MYLSINPYDFKNSFSLNYRTISSQALFKAGPQFSQLRRNSVSGRRHSSPTYFYEDTKVVERFQIIDLWGKFFVSPKLQVALNIPFEYNDYKLNGKLDTELRGMGDISALGFYQVHNTVMDSVNTWRQRLTVGGGVKLPTGNFKAMKDDELIDADMQLGTGSLDFMILTSYMIRYQKLGLKTLLSYKFNGQNNINYSFANGTNVTTALFYQLKVGKNIALLPEAGLYYEAAERDTKGGEVVLNTGGEAMFGTYGVKLVKMPFVLEFNYQQKVSESLNDVQKPNNDRFIIGLSYNIASKFSY